MKKTSKELLPSDAVTPSVEQKPKGRSPELSGLIEVETTEPLVKDGRAILRKDGSPVFKSEKVGDFAVWPPKEGTTPNPMGSDFFGNITFMNRRGNIELFMKDNQGRKNMPVIIGVVYDHGRNEVGEVALWPGQSTKKNAPKYYGTLTMKATGQKFRASVWGPKAAF